MRRASALRAAVAAGLLLQPLIAHSWVRYNDGRAAGVSADGEVLFTGPHTARFDPIFGAPRWSATQGIGASFAVGLFDSADDAIAAASFQYLYPFYEMRVHKVDGVTGSALWYDVIGPADAPNHAADLAVDPANDVLVGATFGDGSGGTDAVVLKLSGADGSQLWQYTFDNGQDEIGQAVAVLSTGDVVGGIDPRHIVDPEDFVVVRLDGSSGTETWRYTVAGVPGSEASVTDVAIDANDDVIAVGWGVSGGTEGPYAVKLDGADGSLIWLYDGRAAGGARFRRVVVDASGDAYVCTDFLTKLSGATGSVLWSNPISPSADCRGVTVEPGGDPIGVGAAGPFGAPRNGILVRLDATTGGLVWRAETENQPTGVGVGGNIVAAAADGEGGAIAVRLDNGSHAMLDSGPLACQQALDKAMGKYFVKRTVALAKCRDLVNAGTLAIPPASCASEPKTATKLANAGGVARLLVAARCTDTNLAELAACADTLDAVVSPAGDSGCFIAAADAAIDALLDVTYGTASPPLPEAEAACQAAIAKATVILGKARLKGHRRELELFLKGNLNPPTFFFAPTARDKFRLKVASACTDALVASLGGCATTMAGLEDPGCVVPASEAARDALVAAINDP